MLARFPEAHLRRILHLIGELLRERMEHRRATAKSGVAAKSASFAPAATSVKCARLVLRRARVRATPWDRVDSRGGGMRPTSDERQPPDKAASAAKKREVCQ